jgi:SAM-dependent methyltransferase
MAGKFFFTLAYWFNQMPWNTGITPPEVYAFLEENPPGRALDLGCGTGTNVLTLAKYGWQVLGVDYVPRAIRMARRKISQEDFGDNVDFLVGDVLDPGLIEGEYDFILDIGCFHSFSGTDIDRYKDIVSSRLVPGGHLLLYVHLSESPGSGHGTKEADLKILETVLSQVWRHDGFESYRPSAWLKYRKR